MFRLLLLTYQVVVEAVDAASSSSHEEVPTNCADSCSKRTLFNIIWGCLSTTIVCAWTVVHPNIPPREGPVKRTLRRLELMFWTIMAPEILPAWALNQRLAAMTIRDMYNKENGYGEEKGGIWTTLKGWFSFSEIQETASQAWTLQHGHFLIMGGFHLVEPAEGDSTLPEATTSMQQSASDVVNVQAMRIPSTDAERGGPENKPEPEKGRVTILTLEMLRVLVNDPEFRIRITDEEMADRSKGGALSKIIFALQSSSFIFLCIARRVQGLALTQLELTTLALASLNGITLILWWDKPLDVQAPVRVYMKRKLTDAERNTKRRLISNLNREFRQRLVTEIKAIISGESVSRTSFFVSWCIRLPYYIWLLLVSPITAFGTAFIFTILELMGGSLSFPVEARHVPTFYVPRHQYSKLHALLLIALAATFGGIHCAGWNLPFPTNAEKELWRVASLVITIIPIAAFPFVLVVSIIAFILRPILDRLDRLLGLTYRLHGLPELVVEIFKFSSNYRPILRIAVVVAFINYILVYAFARLLLLGLALVLLRHQPPSAFTTVELTKFYPHIL